MRAIISFLLIIFFFFVACSSNPIKHRKRALKNPSKELLIFQQSAPSTKKHRRKIKNSVLPSVGSSKKILLPTQIHLIDGTLMVLVNPLIHKSHDLNLMRKKSTPLNKKLNTSKKIKAFYIDHTEVTLEQYKKTHPEHNEITLSKKNSCPSCPAMGIDWENADKHCRLIGKRLPTEEEWELAGQGLPKRPLSLSNKMGKPTANLVGEGDGFLTASPVGSFPLGAGFYGAVDMIGNVWEWVSTPHSPLPKNLKRKKNKTFRISKGGSWASQNNLANTSYRNIVDGNTKNPTFGFRCVKSVN